MAFQTTLEVFQEMEHMDLLSKSDMKLLESIIQPICPVLTEDIHHYEAQYCKLQKIIVANV